MPSVAVRLTESEHQALVDAAGDGTKTDFIKKCLRLHPHWLALKLAYGEDAVSRKIESMVPGGRVNIDLLKAGDVIILDGQPYVVGNYVQEDRGIRLEPMRVCVSADGKDKVRRIPPGQIVQRGSRLDQRIPPHRLALTRAEENILRQLADGPKPLEEICKSAVNTRSHNPRRMIASPSQVADFLRYCIPMLLDDLITVDLDRAKTAPWRLTERGRAVAHARGWNRR